eukprot:TRINITY_DN7410_c0_g1_i1.p1 TRINITY_DN7410_c0_g1~~TRINITY_DN7410_c0_g1_i1.p1  ORF type:complete len:168 (+),score=29.99 TRINITY_DN7410_c0_g1_i1:191-694(+)
MGSRVLFRLALQTGKVNHSSLQHVNYQALLNSTQCGLRGRHRHMSVLNEFSKRIKGELESNPELQKSIKELKEKAEGFKEITEDLKTRTKQTTKNLYEQADAVRAEAELKAKQVSTAMKEKISAASEQVFNMIAYVFVLSSDTIITISSVMNIIQPLFPIFQSSYRI